MHVPSVQRYWTQSKAHREVRDDVMSVAVPPAGILQPGN